VQRRDRRGRNPLGVTAHEAWAWPSPAIGLLLFGPGQGRVPRLAGPHRSQPAGPGPFQTPVVPADRLDHRREEPAWGGTLMRPKRLAVHRQGFTHGGPRIARQASFRQAAQAAGGGLGLQAKAQRGLARRFRWALLQALSHVARFVGAGGRTSGLRKHRPVSIRVNRRRGAGSSPSNGQRRPAARAGWGGGKDLAGHFGEGLFTSRRPHAAGSWDLLEGGR